MIFLSLLLGLALASQMPLQAPMNTPREFALKEGKNLFSPKDMLALPRPGAGLANPSGDLALVTVSQHSFEEAETKKTVYVIDISADLQLERLQLALTKVGETFWLDDRTVGHVLPGDGGKGQKLYAIPLWIDTQSKAIRPSNGPFPPLVGTFPPGADATNFIYSSESGKLIFSAYVYPDHDLKTIQKQDEEYENRGNTALVYDTTYPRHWDAWQGPKKSSLFTVDLSKDGGSFKLGGSFFSPLKDSGHNTPVEPYGGLDHFTVSASHVVYTAKDPVLPEAWHTRQNIYVAPLDASSPPVELTAGDQGATSSPIFSHNGLLVAWLQMAKDGYEADRNQIMLYDLTTSKTISLTPTWDRSPDSIAFSTDDKVLYLTAGEHAHIKIFVLPVPGAGTKAWDAYQPSEPKVVVGSHASSAIQPLPDSRLLFTQNSLTSPNELFVASAKGELEQRTNFAGNALKEKKMDEGEAFWFESEGGRMVHGWALRPYGFKEGEEKSVPVVMLVHGGPQGAWEDQWSTRWNPNVFAGQGYFVLAMNPTGSTSFGQNFTDAIAKNWGGAPFEDLLAGYKFALKKWPEIDPNRAVAAGGSWGGYAVNWIQGHPEYGFGFKAFACHDGVYDSSYNGASTDELYFFNHEFGGPPWTEIGRKYTQLFSPANYVQHWSTPQLIIHGSKDYRLAETEGLAAFNALQQKGVPSRLVIFPDENHWVLKPGNSLKWHHEVFKWFDTYVNPQ